MQIKPISSDRDYRRALEQIEKLMDARPATADGDVLDVLATLVEAWEQKHHPIDAPDVIEATRFALEQRTAMGDNLERSS